MKEGLLTVVMGTPTAPDVNLLLDAFGVPAEGTVIKYESIETIINTKRKGDAKERNRFRCVESAWRKKLYRQSNVELDPIGDGSGLVALAPGERISKSVRNTMQGWRKVRRANDLSVKTDRTRLNPEDQATQDRLGLKFAAIRLAMATEPSKLNYPTPEKAKAV